VVMGGYDCTDVRDLTRAEIEGRRQALMAIEALRRFTPGFENARLRTFGMTLGTRDSRKIVGRYDLTGHDVRNEARFDDSVGIFPEFLDGYGMLVLPTTGRYFQVPYGILVPQDVDNLLVAGRCVAGDKVSHAATRSQMCCAVTGQAAGVAAAVSLKDGRSTAMVDVRRVQAALQQQGVRLA
jgi:FAD dependent oxidoreductase